MVLAVSDYNVGHQENALAHKDAGKDIKFVAEKLRHDKRQQAHQLKQRVLQRRARQQNAALRLDLRRKNKREKAEREQIKWESREEKQAGG